MRGNMMRMAGTIAAIAMVVGGCSCPPAGGDCTDTTIIFDTPVGGMTVDAPFDVSVAVKNADGTAFNIDAATLNVGGMSFTGTVSGNRATFSGVTAAAGEQTLSVSIARDTCSKTVTSTVTVRDTCTAPAVTAVTFPQDSAAPLGVLNNAELPQGQNLSVKVDATCVNGVQVRIKRGTATVGGPVDFVNGTVTLTLATLPDSDNARYDLFAELVKDGAAVNTVTGNPQASASIQVSRAAPTVTLTTQASYGPGDDANTAMSGFQVRVTGTAPPNTSCTLTVTGQTPQSVMPSMSGDVSADFTVTSGTYMATLSCVDGSGNTGTATSTFIVDFDPPTVVITSPANVDGGATTVVTQSPIDVTVTTTGAEDGSMVSVTRNGMTVDTTTITGGMATVQVPFGIDGTYTIVVTVTDLAGNSASATLTVTVQLSGCGAQFSRPMVCPALLTPAQMPGGNYTFQTSSNAVCSGQMANLFRADVLADGGTLAEVATGSTTLNGSGVASFPPLMLASGEYVFRAEVINPGPDAGVSTVSCAVTVDLDGPSITNPVVPGGSMFATIPAVQDTQPGTPGVQRQLAFSARVPQGGRVDVCTTQAIDPVTMQQRLTSPECGSGWYVLAQGVTSGSGFTFPNGSYQIKVVVVGGGATPESPPVALLVDDTRPCVTASSRRLPQDTNGDGKLNIAELNGAQPQLEFALGCGDTNSATLAMTNAVAVRDIVGGAAGAVRPSTTSFTGNVATVTLTGSYAAEIDLNLFVELTDQVGNRNSIQPTNDPSTFTFRVDPVAPSCVIQSPGAGQTLFGQSGAPGGMFPVVVGTSADVGTNGVRVTFGAVAPRDLTPSANTAQTTFAVTGTNAYAIAATCTDASGNATPATGRNVTIDLDAPTCSIVAPTAMTYMVNQITTTVNVTGAEGQPVTVRTSLQGSPLTPTLTVSSGVATGSLTYPNGTQTVSADVADLAGNTCTAMVANVIINSSACALTLTNVFTNSAGNWFNRSNTGNLTATTGVVSSVTANSADCRAGQTVTLQRTAPTAGSVLMSSTSAAGDVSFANLSVSDGETYAMVINNGTGVLTTQTFRVGLRVPSATTVSIGGNNLTTGQPLFFVAPTTTTSGNINLDATATGGMPKVTTYFPDTQTGTAGAQVNLAATAIAGTKYGADNGRIDVLYGATNVLGQTLMSDPVDLSSTGISLTPQNSSNTFIVRITSAAGNVSDVISNAATVDVVAPAAPTYSQTLTSARAATVTLGWMPVYDDGTDNTSGGLVGGPPTQLAGYDVRWTTSSLPAGNSLTAVADFFGSLSKQDGITAWSASAISHPITLPPINTYFIAVRARDDVGNYSTYTAPTGLANPWTTTTISAPVASTNFGSSVVVAPLTGNDSTPEMVVSATTRGGVGSVYVYSSTVLGASITGCAAGCQELTPSDTTAGAFGNDLSVGNVGAVAAEVKPDLIIGQTWTANGNSGRAVLFFGTTAATLNGADSIEFRGDTNNRIGQTVAVIKDITGDGRDEIAFAAPLFSSNRGRIFIYRGRDRADWLTIRTAMDATTMVPYVPVGTANADYVIDGPTPLLVSPAGNAFGQNRRGLVSVNDLDGDGFPDVAIPMSRGSINRYRVFGSATIKTSSGASPLDSTAAFRLEISEPVTTDNSVTSGVGTAALANADFFGSSGADLVLAFPGAGGGGQIAFYSALTAPTTPTLNPSPAYRITGPLTYGQAIAMGTLDGDLNQDFVSGTNVATGNVAIVAYQNAGAFETNLAGGNTFFVSRFDALAVTGNANSRLGVVSLITDVITGDSANDLVLADFIGGEVRIWR